MIKNKIKTLGKLKAILKKHKLQGKKIITTNGVFDILHPGHVKYLEKAKRLGDILIVGVNSDSSVKQNKGDKRPINGEKSRTEVLAALESVDFVFVFGEKDPRKWLSEIKPNVHVKAGDYKGRIIEQDVVEKNGGSVKIMVFEKGHSTTDTIKRILDIYR